MLKVTFEFINFVKVPFWPTEFEQFKHWKLEKINQKGSVYKQNTEGYNYALPDLYRGEMGSDEIETE